MPHDPLMKKHGLPYPTLLPPRELEPTEVLILSHSSARQLAAESIKIAQARYKRTYDKLSREVNYQLGDWVMTRQTA